MRIGQVELAITVKFPAFATRNTVMAEFLGQFIHPFFTILGSINSVAFIFLDIIADQPIT